MKTKLVCAFFLVAIHNQLAASEQHDSGARSVQIKVETGCYNTIFIKKNGDRLANQANRTTFLKYLGQIRGTCVVDDKYYLSFDYKRYYYSNWSNRSFEPGTLISRDFHLFNLSVGRNMICRSSKIKVYSYLNLCARPSGGERVLVAPGIYGDLHAAAINGYAYHSAGIGAGSCASVIILKHLSISLDLQYNYLFENKNAGRNSYSTEDFNESEYRVNRQMLSPSINFGYTFRINGRKKTLDQ